ATLHYKVTLFAGTGRSPYATLASPGWQFPINGEEPVEPWFSADRSSGAGQLDSPVHQGRGFTWLLRDAPAPDAPEKLKAFLFFGDLYEYNTNNITQLQKYLSQEMYGRRQYQVQNRLGQGDILVPLYARVTGLWSAWAREEKVAQQFAQQ